MVLVACWVMICIVKNNSSLNKREGSRLLNDGTAHLDDHGIQLHMVIYY